MAALPFAIPFKYAAMVALIGFLLAAVSDGCTFKDDCEVNQVCCRGDCIYGSSCAGRYCSSDSDCSSGESCCRQSCVSSSSCAGRYCSSDYDCSSGQSCCSSKCLYGSDCVGFPCSFSSECGSLGTCCHGTCENINDGCVDVAVAVIVSSVVGSLVFTCMISTCIFCGRRRRTIQGGVIVGQSVTATTSTTTRYVTQGNPPYQGQVPPSYSYQQGHPYYPLPQSEQQQQTANPPPYNNRTMAGSEQPPPYPTEPQGASGGVHAPKPSYGTIPSAPAV